jgi:trehalose 6-phosphate phosphatase
MKSLGKVSGVSLPPWLLPTTRQNDAEAQGKRWAVRLRRARRLLLCLDFDGTLVPIQDHPDQVWPTKRLHQLLAQLSASGDLVVAVLSGRALSDLRKRLDLPGIVYSGNHGLEIQGPGWSHVEPLAAQRAPALAELGRRLDRALSACPGCWVEDKGLTLCVHYRRASPAAWSEVERIVAEVCQEHHDWLTLRAGKRTWDLFPGPALGKGTAVSRLLQRHAGKDVLGLAIGDDTTDEDMFQVLEDGLTVRVGENQGTAARYCLPGPAEVHEFLSWLAHWRANR